MKLIYEIPQVEVIEIEVEGAILNASDFQDGGIA